jgi:hypothetical protein
VREREREERGERGKRVEGGRERGEREREERGGRGKREEGEGRERRGEREREERGKRVEGGREKREEGERESITIHRTTFPQFVYLVATRTNKKHAYNAISSAIVTMLPWS